MMSLRLIKDISRISRRLSTISLQNGNKSKITAGQYFALNKHLTASDSSNLEQGSLVFRSNNISLDITVPWRHNSIINPSIENPLISHDIEEAPSTSSNKEITEKQPSHIQDFELPTFDNKIGKDGIQAAVMIGIRKKKMKKHKLRKLRKKMKFEWAKVRQRRELRKEKAFQANLIAQIKEAEKFSAEQYVAEKLRQANETPIPRLWKGKRLPEFIIRQLMEKEAAKKDALKEKALNL